jgi:hypothetical protein
VTLNGEPIEIGSISFIPQGETVGMTAGGAIENGVYSIAANQGPVLGSHSVAITSPRKTGRKIPAAMGNPGELMDEVTESVPAKYNVRSTLVVDIKSGDNELNFDLN